MKGENGYLRLTRREGDVVMIGDDITIRITKIGFKQVEIGFSAPRDVQILREEVYRRKLFENGMNGENLNDSH